MALGAGFEINLERTLKLILIHDLVEIYAGDTHILMMLVQGLERRNERKNLLTLVCSVT